MRVFQVNVGAGLTLRALSVIDGGGIQFAGDLRVERCFFSGNTASGSGGAVSSLFGSSGTFLAVNSTFAANRAGFGGAVYNGGNNTTTLRHCTLSWNDGKDFGGGLIALGTAGTATVENCVIAGNTATNGPDIYLETANFTVLGNNVIGDNNSIAALFPVGNPNATYRLRFSFDLKTWTNVPGGSSIPSGGAASHVEFNGADPAINLRIEKN